MIGAVQTGTPGNCAGAYRRFQVWIELVRTRRQAEPFNLPDVLRAPLPYAVGAMQAQIAGDCENLALHVLNQVFQQDDGALGDFAALTPVGIQLELGEIRSDDLRRNGAA